MQNILNHKKYLFIVSTIIILFSIWGFLYYYSIKDNITNTIINFNNINIKYMIFNIFIYSMLLTLSFFLISVPLSIIYLGYESFLLGFITNMILKIYNIKGIFIILLYLPLKIISIILLILFIYRLFNISKSLITYLIYKEEYIKNKIVYNYKNCLYIIGISFILDFILFICIKVFIK